MPYPLIAGLVIALIVLIIALSTTISCTLLAKATQRVGVADIIIGWATFIVISFAVVGGVISFIIVLDSIP